MKGSIRQRSKGSWEIFYDMGADPVTGKRRQKSQTVKGTKRDAQRRLREVLLSIEQSSYVKPNKITLGEWLRDYVSMNTTDRTQESYSYIVEGHLIPSLGKVVLADLQPQDVQRYYAEKLNKGRTDGKGGLSGRSVVYHHRILSKALDYAVKMGVVVRNVANLVEPPRVKKVTMNTLSTEEVTRFLEAAKETDYYVFFATLLYTGLRRGELLALRWRNLDLTKGNLTVVETAYKLGNGDYIIKEPKTAHSRRSVTLSTSLIELLRAYRIDQELLRIQLGVSLNADDFVFIRPDGSPINPSAVTLAFRRDYQKGGFSMLSGADPDGRRTAVRIIIYSLVLFGASLLPATSGLTGEVYLAGAIALGVGLLLLGFQAAWVRSISAARKLSLGTIVYLPVLLILMVLDKM